MHTSFPWQKQCLTSPNLKLVSEWSILPVIESIIIHQSINNVCCRHLFPSRSRKNKNLSRGLLPSCHGDGQWASSSCSDSGLRDPRSIHLGNFCTDPYTTVTLEWYYTEPSKTPTAANCQQNSSNNTATSNNDHSSNNNNQTTSTFISYRK